MKAVKVIFILEALVLIFCISSITTNYLTDHNDAFNDATRITEEYQGNLYESFDYYEVISAGGKNTTLNIQKDANGNLKFKITANQIVYEYPVIVQDNHLQIDTNNYTNYDLPDYYDTKFSILLSGMLITIGLLISTGAVKIFFDNN